MASPRAIARALSRSERAQVKAALKAGDELGYNRNYTRGMIKFGADGMTPEARLARARELGFDVETTQFHGTGAPVPIQGFRASPASDRYGFGSGVYVTRDPINAAFYADPASGGRGEAGSIYPLFVRGKTADQSTVEKALKQRGWENSAARRDLEKQGYDAFTQNGDTVVASPSQVRSPFSTFDPARANRRDLLAGVVPVAAAGGAGALALQPQEAEAAPVGAIRNALRTGDALGYERAYSRALVKGLDTSPEAIAARARAQGYQPFYKGMNEPYRDTGESLGWAGADPRVASTYAASGEGANVMPLMVRTGDLPTVEGGGRLFDEIPLENVPEPLRGRLPTDYAFVPSDLAQAAFRTGQPGVRINNVIDDNVNTFDLTQRTPTDTVQRWPTNGRPETGYRSRFAMFDPARAGRSDIMAGVVPATVALGGAAAAGAALAPQEAQAQTLQPPPPSALARALARQLEKDVGARRREAQGGLGYRIGQVATGLAQSAIEDPFAFIDPTMGFATAVRDDVKTDMDAARSRKTSETLRRAMLRSAPQVKRGAFSGRDTE